MNYRSLLTGIAAGLLLFVQASLSSVEAAIPADAPKDTEQYGVSEKLDALYGLALPQKATVGEMVRKKAYIEIGEKT